MAITYSIDGGADAAKFNINATSGALTFKAAPDFEAPGDANADNVYEVSVKATDATGLASSKLVRVTVTDVSEGSPPQITSAGAVSINENTTTVMVITVFDPDDVTPPPSGAWPGAGNTGVPAGVNLTKVTGNLSSNANNQVIDAKEVTGTIVINHTGVTVKRCKASRIQIGDTVASHNFTIEDCTVAASGGNGIWSINGHDGKILRCNLGSFENFIVLSDGDRCLIQDNWFHDPLPGSPSTAHTDGVQIFPGNLDVNVIHNFFDFPQSGINSNVTTNDVTRIIIDNCKMQCKNYAVYWEGNTTGCVIRNSMFDRAGATSGGGYIGGTAMHNQTYTNNTNWAGNPINLP